MNHAYLSASGGDRADACPASVSLPADPRTNSDDASRGTAIHAYLERLQSIPRGEALAACHESVRETCEAIALEDVPKGDAEIAYVYDVADETVVCLGHIEHRGYTAALGRPLRATEIPCTVDLVIRGADGIEVCDWKTGYENVPDVAASMQLGLAALCVSKSEGVDACAQSIRRIGSDGQVYVLGPVMLDAFALSDMADRWRTVWARVEATRAALAEGDTIATNPGSHCRYCPAAGSCPQFAGIARTMLAPGSDWLDRARSEIESDNASAADLWVKVQRGRELLSTLQGLLDARAIVRPFTLPDGRTVREVSTSRRAVRDAATVRAVLTDLYDAAAADTAVTSKLVATVGAIEKLAASRVEKGKGKAEARRILTVLAERGAVETRTGTSVEAVAPQIGAGR